MDYNKHKTSNINHTPKSNDETIKNPLAYARIDTYFGNLGSFLRYCHYNGIMYLSDLDGFDFDCLINVRGIGKNTIDKIKSQYNDICRELEKTSHVETGLKTDHLNYPFQSVHPSNKLLDIAVIKHWTQSSKIVRSLYDNGYTILKDLEDVSESDFVSLLGRLNSDKICDAAQIFASPLTALIAQLLDTLAEDKNLDIYELRSDGCRLQEIGDLYDLTRERIRQICIKLENKLLPFVELFAKEIEENTGYMWVSNEQFVSPFKNERYAKIAFSSLTNSPKYDYLDFADLVVEKDAYPNAEERLSLLLEEVVDDGINLFDNLEHLENSLIDAGFDYITADHFLNLMIKNKYQFYGDTVIRNKTSYGLLCAEIVADKFPNGIYTTDENLNTLRELAAKKYPGLELPEKNRALKARLTNFLILRGKSEYISPKNVFIEENILKEIKLFIDQHSQESLYFTEIFSEFEGLLTMTTNIDNAHFLHGVLAFYYPNEYTYSKDYLTKRSIQETKSLTDRIEALISASGGALHKKEILNKLPGITENMLLNASLNSQNLISWGTHCYNTMSNISFSEEEIEHLKQILLTITEKNKGYCSEKLFFQKTKHDMLDSLDRNNICNAQNLFYITETLFPVEFEFRHPHIAQRGRFYLMNTKEIALDLMENPDVLCASKFFEMANTLLWPRVTASLIFSEIELDYVRISRDNYVKKENFSLSDESIRFVEDLLERTAGDNWYLPLQQFSAGEIILPDELEFNEFLAASIVKQIDLQWHIVSPRARDRRIEKGILVRNSFNIFSYDSLVAKMLNDAGILKLTESQLLAFLQIHQLARQVVPKELYASECFSVEQEMFYVNSLY